MKLFLLYRLKPGVTREQYRTWSLTRDQPTTGARDGVEGFHIFDVQSPDGSSDFDVVEVVDVADWATWQEIVSSGPSVAIGEEFAELVDVRSVASLCGTEVVPETPNPTKGLQPK